MQQYVKELVAPALDIAKARQINCNDACESGSHHVLIVVAALDPGDSGWGDLLFTTIFAFTTVLLAAYYVYAAFFKRD